jgi:hypothetical protein
VNSTIVHVTADNAYCQANEGGDASKLTGTETVDL